MLYPNILNAIGSTPTIRLASYSTDRINVYAKLEALNPSGSTKDRIALAMIEAAEKSGELTHDKTILEPTSGNTGIALAMVAAVKGYRIVLTMSAGASNERRQMIRAFGAEVVLSPADQGTDGAIRKAKEIYAENPDRYWLPNQYDNQLNPLAHYHTTAVEILRDVPHINMLVAGIGTAGTLVGIARRLKETNPAIHIVAAEPMLGHHLQGLKNMQESIKPQVYDESLIDETVMVRDEDAHQVVRELARKEGIFAGMSSGAALWAAKQLIQKLTQTVVIPSHTLSSLPQGNREEVEGVSEESPAGVISSGARNLLLNTKTKHHIVVILPDRGERYLSTRLWE
jgi:cysteine synthase